MTIRVDGKEIFAANRPVPERKSVSPCPENGTHRANVSPRLLRTPVAASYLGVSQWTLRRLKDEGKIKFVPGEFLRFDIKDLDAYIETQKESAL